MPKPRKLCIFCGGHPITKEHMWPDWLRNYIPRTRLNYHSRSGIMFKKHTKSKISLHGGDPHSSTVRRVCKSCNSGWMSQLQNLAKPILVPLIENGHISLRKRDQTILAEWITMFTMVAEFKLRSEELVSISAEERHQFKNTQRPLKNWKIWIGKTETDNWKGKYVHTTLAVSSDGVDIAITSDGVPVPNTQTTTFLVGKLYVHVVSSSSFNPRKQQISTRLVQRIWPTKTKLLKWPPRWLLSDEEAEGLSMALLRGVAKRTGAAEIP